MSWNAKCDTKTDKCKEVKVQCLFVLTNFRNSFYEVNTISRMKSHKGGLWETNGKNKLKIWSSNGNASFFHKYLSYIPVKLFTKVHVKKGHMSNSYLQYCTDDRRQPPPAERQENKISFFIMKQIQLFSPTTISIGFLTYKRFRRVLWMSSWTWM